MADFQSGSETTHIEVHGPIIIFVLVTIANGYAAGVGLFHCQAQGLKQLGRKSLIELHARRLTRLMNGLVRRHTGFRYDGRDKHWLPRGIFHGSRGSCRG
jgi:hypothetical protein